MCVENTHCLLLLLLIQYATMREKFQNYTGFNFHDKIEKEAVFNINFYLLMQKMSMIQLFNFFFYHSSRDTKIAEFNMIATADESYASKYRCG